MVLPGSHISAVSGGVRDMCMRGKSDDEGVREGVQVGVGGHKQVAGWKQAVHLYTPVGHP